MVGNDNIARAMLTLLEKWSLPVTYIYYVRNSNNINAYFLTYVESKPNRSGKNYVRVFSIFVVSISLRFLDNR